MPGQVLIDDQQAHVVQEPCQVRFFGVSEPKRLGQQSGDCPNGHRVAPQLIAIERVLGVRWAELARYENRNRHVAYLLCTQQRDRTLQIGDFLPHAVERRVNNADNPGSERGVFFDQLPEIFGVGRLINGRFDNSKCNGR